jgi:hypothetical protein
MHAGLAIVLRTDGHTLGDELLAQLDVVHHVAIVRAHHIAIRVQVRLRVDLRWFSERCPAQLGNAARPGHLGKAVFLRHCFHFADIFAQIDGALVQRRRADRVIAAIGQSLCCFDQNGAKLFFLVCYVSEDTAHLFFSLIPM